VRLLHVLLAGILIVTCVVAVQAEELAQAVIAPVAQQPKIVPLKDGIDGVISLDLRKIDITDALKYFSLKSGLNIVTTKSVSGRVTMVVENVPVQDVLDIMLRSNGLAYDKVGDIYNIMTQEEYKVLYGKKFSDIRHVKIFRLKYAIPEQAFNLLEAVKSEIGRILVDPESGSVLVMDSQENITQMEAILKEFEKENLVRIFTLNYAKAKVVEEQLQKLVDAKKVGSVKADERANQLIVQAFPGRMKEIERIIKALDKKTKEVLIDAKIVRAKIGDGTEVGIEWEGLFDVSEKNGLAYIGSTPFAAVQSTTADYRTRKDVQDQENGLSYPFSGTTSNFSSSRPTIGLDQLHIGVVGSSDFDLMLTWLTTINEAKILSNPKIAVTNNQEARIHVGAKEAYVTTTTTTGQSTSTISEQVNFIDIGIQLNVTPVINDDGFISMKIKAEISDVISILNTPTGNQIPIVDTSLAETNVLIKEGATIVIGGLRKEEKTKAVQKIPILGDIPILGLLFRKSSDTSETTELLIMVTPKIISGEALVETHGDPVGDPGIKPVKEYEDVDRAKKEMQTYMPPPPEEEFGGMELKSFKPYKRPINKE